MVSYLLHNMVLQQLCFFRCPAWQVQQECPEVSGTEEGFKIFLQWSGQLQKLLECGMKVFVDFKLSMQRREC